MSCARIHQAKSVQLFPLSASSWISKPAIDRLTYFVAVFLAGAFCADFPGYFITAH
jgi:hypothetical protein